VTSMSTRVESSSLLFEECCQGSFEAEQRRLAFIPLLLDSSPGALLPATAIASGSSACGLELELVAKTRIEAFAAVIGCENLLGRRLFATLMIDSQTLMGETLRIRGHWANEDRDDVLAPERLRPRVDPRSLRFVYGLPEDILDRWCDLGVMRRYLVDRVMLCDRCQAIPSWRQGCHVCGSGRITKERLVHHFACSHLDRAIEFETAEGLQCPRCGVSNLVADVDFEAIDGPVNCFDCRATGGKTVMAAMCHGCHRRFGMEDALEHSLNAYHVERLDPLHLFERTGV